MAGTIFSHLSKKITGAVRSTNEEGHKNNPSDEKRSPKEKEKEH